MVEIVELRFDGNPLILSEGVLPRSDTIFGFLYVNLLRSGYDPKNSLFKNEFNVSSMLPVAEVNGEKIFFLYKPLNIFKPYKFDSVSNREMSLLKKKSKARFISLNVLKQGLTNLDELFLVSGDYLITSEEMELFNNVSEDLKFFSEDEVSRVSIRRVVKNSDERTTPFTTNVTWPLHNDDISVNAYFMIKGLTKEIKESVDLMKFFGLGGKVSYGKNFVNDINFLNANNIFGSELLDFNGPGFSISVFIPQKEDLEAVKDYLVISRNSYLYNTKLKKKFVNKLIEGSTFTRIVKGYTNCGVEGVVKYDYPKIYYSFCKPFPIKLNGDLL